MKFQTAKGPHTNKISAEKCSICTGSARVKSGVGSPSKKWGGGTNNKQTDPGNFWEALPYAGRARRCGPIAAVWKCLYIWSAGTCALDSRTRQNSIMGTASDTRGERSFGSTPLAGAGFS